MLIRLATTKSIAWKAHFACQFRKYFLLVISKKCFVARVCVVAKLTNIVLDKQNFKCLPNNVCPFGRGLKADFLSWQKLLATIFFQKKCQVIIAARQISIEKIVCEGLIRLWLNDNAMFYKTLSEKK